MDNRKWNKGPDTGSSKYTPPNGKRIAAVFSIPITFWLIGQLHGISPRIFEVLITVAAVTVGIALAYRSLSRWGTIKCPDCGGPMDYIGNIKLLGQTLSRESGLFNQSVYRRVERCRSCGAEYHELVYESGTPLFPDRNPPNPFADCEFTTVKLTQKEREVDFRVRQVSDRHYRAMVERLADEVLANNRRYGFKGDPIKIDLEE